MKNKKDCGLNNKPINALNEYDEQAEKFLKSTKTEFKAEFVEYGRHFEEDTTERDIYLITLTRGAREFKFRFGQSEHNSGLILTHKHNGERTRHKNFILPQEIREKMRVWEERRKADGKRFFSNPLKVWFESKYFNLGGLNLEYGKKPSAYSVLACLTTSNPYSLKDFCDEYGYNEDSKKAERIYKAVVNEFLQLQALYNEKEINKLAEIC